MITASAFYDCDHLPRVTVPHGVKSIGEEAFVSCYNLRSVTLPSSVTEIGKDAFRGHYTRPIRH